MGRRLTDFARGSHIPAAWLNGHQDEAAIVVAASGAPPGAPALRGADARWWCTPDGGVADAQLAVVDAGLDWRSRVLWGAWTRLESAAQRAQGPSAWQQNDPARSIQRRGFEGRAGAGATGAAGVAVVAGAPPVVGAGSFAVLLDERGAGQRAWLYARPDDGALCLYNATGAALHGELLVWGAGVAPTAGAPVPSPIPTLTDLQWLAPTTLAARPANPGADVRGLHRATDTGDVALWDGGAWRAVGGAAPGLARTELALLSGAHTLDPGGASAPWWNLGAWRCDPADWPATATFSLRAEGSTVHGVTGQVRLVRADTGAVVSGLPLELDADAVTSVSGALALVAAPTVYVLQARDLGVDAGDTFTLLAARVVVTA